MNLRLLTILSGCAVLAGSFQVSAATLSFDNVSFPGTGVPLSVTGSDGTVFNFTAGQFSQFESFQSGGIGSFPAGQFFLAPGLGNTTPITVSISAPIDSIKFPVSSDRTGDSPFTTTVQFFDGTTNVGSVSHTGNTLNPPVTFSFAGQLTGFVIDTSVADAPFGYTQNVGAFNYTVSAVPLPASAPLLGAALLGLAGFGVVTKRRNETRVRPKSC